MAGLCSCPGHQEGRHARPQETEPPGDCPPPEGLLYFSGADAAAVPCTDLQVSSIGSHDRERGAEMNRISGLLLILACLFVLGLPAVRAAGPNCPDPLFCVLEERQLTTSAADQLDPAISGNYVVYTDSRNSDNDVYGYNLQTNQEFQITSGGGDQMLSAINGEWVAYTDFGRGNADVVVYNVRTTQSVRVPDSIGSNQRKPSISGHRVVYEDDRTGDWDIYLFDLATNTETRLTTDPAYQRNPVISGNIVAWEDYRNGHADIYMMNVETNEVRQITSSPGQETDHWVDGDIIVYFSNAASVGDVLYYRISTGETVSVTQASAAFERNPTVSGDFIGFESYADGNAHLWVHSISLGLTRQVTAAPGNQYLHDLSGNRVVYTDDRNGNLDIYLATFSFGTPDIAVVPVSLDFGEVEQGTSRHLTVTVSNQGSYRLQVRGVSLVAGTSGEFQTTLPSALPIYVEPGKTLDVTVTYTPADVGIDTGVLEILSDDPDEPVVTVSLRGAGVPAEDPPAQQIAEILQFFDESVHAGTLVGNGPGLIGYLRLYALRAMLQVAAYLIKVGDITCACYDLQHAYQRTDGNPRPPDFVTGPAALELAAKILDLRANLGCVGIGM
jgi:TolB protein